MAFITNSEGWRGWAPHWVAEGDLPAIEGADGNKSWWLNGVEI